MTEKTFEELEKEKIKENKKYLDIFENEMRKRCTLLFYPSQECFPCVYINSQNGPEQQQNGGEAGGGPEHRGPQGVGGFGDEAPHLFFKAFAEGMRTVLRLRKAFADSVQIFVRGLFEKLLHQSGTPSSSHNS